MREYYLCSNSNNNNNNGEPQNGVSTRCYTGVTEADYLSYWFPLHFFGGLSRNSVLYCSPQLLITSNNQVVCQKCWNNVLLWQSFYDHNTYCRLNGVMLWKLCWSWGNCCFSLDFYKENLTLSKQVNYTRDTLMCSRILTLLLFCFLPVTAIQK